MRFRKLKLPKKFKITPDKPWHFISPLNCLKTHYITEKVRGKPSFGKQWLVYTLYIAAERGRVKCSNKKMAMVPMEELVNLPPWYIQDVPDLKRGNLIILERQWNQPGNVTSRPPSDWLTYLLWILHDQSQKGTGLGCNASWQETAPAGVQYTGAAPCPLRPKLRALRKSTQTCKNWENFTDVKFQ